MTSRSEADFFRAEDAYQAYQVLHIPLSLQIQKSDTSHKHVVMCQYRACTGPMLAASDQYRPGTGNYRHVYRVCGVDLNANNLI